MVVLSIAADASNQDVFQMSKVQTMKLACKYLLQFDPLIGFTDFDDNDLTMWGDLLIVRDGSGFGCFSLILRQLETLGLVWGWGMGGWVSVFLSKVLCWNGAPRPRPPWLPFREKTEINSGVIPLRSGASLCDERHPTFRACVCVDFRCWL